MLKITKSKNIKKQTGNKYLYIAFILNLLLIGHALLIKTLSIHLNYLKYVSLIYFGMIIILILFFLPSIHTMGKNKIKNYIVGLCISASVIYIAISFGAGMLMKNLSSSPYDTSLKGIFGNITTQMPEVIAFILVRSYSVNAIYRKTSRPYIWIVVISLYLVILQLNFTKLSITKSYEDIFIYFVNDVLPKISLSILMTIICLTGGSLPCIYYISINKIFMFVFPFLPSLPWIAESVIGIAYPIMLSMFIWEEYKILSNLKIITQKENIISFSASLILLVAFSWFTVGVFDIYPSVILTGSMEPLIYPGDIILIKKFSSEEEIYNLKSGDIINFKRDNITITHRIAEVKSDDAGNISFETKGDNNASQDLWIVNPNDLKGIVKNVLPKIGIPVLFLHSSENIPKGVINY